jgi:hypothetical protein
MQRCIRSPHDLSPCCPEHHALGERRQSCMHTRTRRSQAKLDSLCPRQPKPSGRALNLVPQSRSVEADILQAAFASASESCVEADVLADLNFDCL